MFGHLVQTATLPGPCILVADTYLRPKLSDVVMRVSAERLEVPALISTCGDRAGPNNDVRCDPLPCQRLAEVFEAMMIVSVPELRQ